MTVSNKTFILLLDIIAFIAGCLLPLAFAPYHLSIMSFVSTSLLLSTWINATPSKAFLRGFLFGLGFFGFGVSWVFVSLHTFGYAPIFLAGLITFLFISLLSIAPAINGYLLQRMFKHSIYVKNLLAFPLSWVICEWLRGNLFTGFPWLFLGYSQLHTPLAHIAPILSVYGVSFAVALTSGAIVTLLSQRNLKVCCSVISMLLIIWLGSAALGLIHWTQITGKAIKVSLIQGNISQSSKWDINKISDILNVYQSETEKHWQSQIIVWPEAAVPAFPFQVAPYLKNLNQLAKQHQSSIIVGIPIQKQDKFYNGLIVLGDGHGEYLKRHLVPFGEYMPFRKYYAWLRSYIQIPMSNFSAGSWQQKNIVAAGIEIASYICYEIAYPNEVLQTLGQAKLLLIITDDSWFGDSNASTQQMQIAAMRALENGRYLISASNNGVTAIANPQGRIIEKIAKNKQLVLTATVYAMRGHTPLFYLNIKYLILFFTICYLLLYLFDRKKIKNSSASHFAKIN